MLKNDFYLEFSKIQLIILGGGVTALQIGFEPSPYLYGVGIGLLCFSFMISLAMLLDTNFIKEKEYHNILIYMTIEGILLMIIGLSRPLIPSQTTGLLQISIYAITPLMLATIAILIRILIHIDAAMRWVYEPSSQKELFDRNESFEIIVFYGFVLIMCMLAGSIYVSSIILE